jgi:selenocysteine lyase/cysteine desulfurase
MNKLEIFSFNLVDIHAQDVVSYLETQRVAMRAEIHCAQTLTPILGISGTLTILLCLYNTKQEIDKAAKALWNVKVFS